MPEIAVNLPLNIGDTEPLTLVLFNGESQVGSELLTEVPDTLGRFVADFDDLESGVVYRAVVVRDGLPIYEGWLLTGEVDQPVTLADQAAAVLAAAADNPIHSHLKLINGKPPQPLGYDPAKEETVQAFAAKFTDPIIAAFGWLTSMIVDDDGPKFTSDALVNTPMAPQAGPVLPGVGYVPKRGSRTEWEVYQGELVHQFTDVYQHDGQTPIDLSGKTLELVFERKNGKDVDVITAPNLTITGEHSNRIEFDYTEAVTKDIGTRTWALRDVANPKTVWLYGTLEIKKVPMRGNP